MASQPLQPAGAKPSSQPVITEPQQVQNSAAVQAYKLPLANHSFTYYSSADLNATQEQIERCVLVIHGTRRNALDYWQHMQQAGQRAQTLNSTLILAPQFSIQGDSLQRNALYWDLNSAWKIGNLSSKDHSPRISSFRVIDALIESLSDQKRFPNLKKIVIVGHSAGGQFVQRYALGAHPHTNLPLVFVVANPSSYAYLDARRPLKNKPDQIGLPTEKVPGYNHWKYGLEHLNAYMKEQSKEALIAQYPAKNVIYLVGEKDILQDKNLDTTPMARLQGENRLQRGLNYYRYLTLFYGKSVHQFRIVPGVGHNHAQIFSSKEGLKAIFGP